MNINEMKLKFNVNGYGEFYLDQVRQHDLVNKVMVVYKDGKCDIVNYEDSLEVYRFSGHYYYRDEAPIYEGESVRAVGDLTGCNVDFTGVVKFYESIFVVDNGKKSLPLWSEEYYIERVKKGLNESSRFTKNKIEMQEMSIEQYVSMCIVLTMMRQSRRWDSGLMSSRFKEFATQVDCSLLYIDIEINNSNCSTLFDNCFIDSCMRLGLPLEQAKKLKEYINCKSQLNLEDMGVCPNSYYDYGLGTADNLESFRSNHKHNIESSAELLRRELKLK